MAGQLTQHWNSSVWNRVGRLLAEGVPPAAEPCPAPPPRQRQVRLRPEQIDALVTDYESGMSVGAVARKHGININTATSHLNRRGIKIRRSNHLIPATQHAALLQLKAQGLNTTQIGEHFGCSRSSVQRALRRAEQS